MRVAVLSDIHGNLPALEAVLADVEREDVDRVVVAGDSVSGPFPAEVFDRLAALGALHVSGNAERLVLTGGEGAGAMETFSAERLGDRRAAVETWPLTLELEIDGLGEVLVCHATPASDEELYTRISPDDEVAALFDGVRADVVVCGHTHGQYDRTLAGGLRLVNPGSVGMSYEDEPGAFWAVLGPEVELRRTEYDVDAAVAAIRATDAPDVDQLLVRYLLEPVGADRATAFFESQRGA